MDIKPILDTVRWIAFASKVEGTRPISLLIITDAESGKSFSLNRFKSVPAFYFYGDLTAYGILKQGGLDLVYNEGKTHFVCPDFIPIISRKQHTVQTIIGLLNELVWDGLDDMSTFAIDKIDKKYWGLKCGLITAITKDIFFNNQYLRSSGFLSRFLILSYTLDEDSRKQIDELIYTRKKVSPSPINLTLPSKKVEVVLPKDKEFKEEFYRIRDYCKTHSPTGLRMTEILKSLLQGIALSKKRKKVVKEDLEELESLSHYFNEECNLYPERDGEVSKWKGGLVVERERV